MAKKQASKLHHYVPQGYLRGFATNKERISVIPLNESRRTFTTNIRNVAARSHFHTLEGIDEPDVMEKGYAETEGTCLPLIRRLARGELSLDRSERFHLSFYIALQAVRGPFMREIRDDMAHKTLTMTLKYLDEEGLTNNVVPGGGQDLHLLTRRPIQGRAPTCCMVFQCRSGDIRCDATGIGAAW